jgi:integrase
MNLDGVALKKVYTILDSHVSVNPIFEKKVLEKAELPDRRLHDTRHSYASLMLKNGASLDYVKRMLGHADISMTSNTYGHLLPDRDRSQVNQLSNSILHPSGTQENEKAVTSYDYDLY